MFNLKDFNAAYCPTSSNEPLVITINPDEIYAPKGYPVKLSGQVGSWTLEGKHCVSSPNPTVFPYTQEWYDKLKVVYPDLKPYVADYRAVIKAILANCDEVVCKVSYIGFDNAITGGDIATIRRNTILSDNLFYVPVNPYTLKPCNSDMDYYVLPDLHIPF